jgi:hypothetical protein
MKKDVEISSYSFDPEKKDYVTRTALEKLLKDIRTQLSKNKRIVVAIKEDA